MGDRRRATFGRMLLAALAAVPALAHAADCGPSSLERSAVERVSPEGDILLKDGRLLRLAGLHLVRIEPSDWPQPGAPVALGLLGEAPDRWGRLPALVFALPEGVAPDWLQARLLARGAALARPEQGLGGCWPLLARAEAAAEARLPALPAEAGRFARVTGRVARVGEGRTAHFVTLYDRASGRVAGLVQKRHLARFKAAGVDVAALRGQWIRLRGVRNGANSAVIPLLVADQIEIVR